MGENHKSYGYEGGYEDWTADKVVKNMRIMQSGKPVADVEETEDIGEASGDEGYTDEDINREEW